MSDILKLCKPAVDFLMTLFFWFYFIFSYILFFIPVILLSYPFINRREAVVQKMNHYFYRIFFWGANAIIPGLMISVSNDVKNTTSSLVISNHRSYLDPILLMSIFPKHKTIVKGIFFKLPIMRWILKTGGYIPYMPDGDYNEYMGDRIQNIPEFIKFGGNLFIFPEGRRSRDGLLGAFKKGAFTLASRYKIPIQVIYIQNSERLFAPGKFFLNTCINNVISVEKLGTINPINNSARQMREMAVALYRNKTG
jgi:1-acyl-sn-glycerol-3-phosphate acyltransferase